MKCSECINNGACAYNIMLPYIKGSANVGPDDPKGKTVNIDKCLLPEILTLWERGIRTTGCCCGHGIVDPFIGVKPEHCGQMTCLGYELFDAQNISFKPKTQFTYGEANKGFNWWEEVPHA